MIKQNGEPSKTLNRSNTTNAARAKPDRKRLGSPMFQVAPSIVITIGAEPFSARLRHNAAPRACAQLQRLLPYNSEVIHARWSGDAVWARLADVWPAGLRLPPESATGNPTPGDVLLFAGEQSEPELLVTYGASRFACQAGALEGNPVLVIEDGLDRLAAIGCRVLHQGAMKLRIECIAVPFDAMGNPVHVRAKNGQPQ